MAVAIAVWLIATLITLLGEPEPMPPGPWEGEVDLLTDPVAGRYGCWAMAQGPVGALLLQIDCGGLGRGDRLHISGEMRGEPGRRSSIAYRATLVVSLLRVVGHTPSPVLAAGDALRGRVMERLEPIDPGRGLLAGFLIGDTSHVDPVDVEAMRATGLSHFVAVSGSNVALYLGLVAMVGGPLALGPRRRAILGLLALPVYAAATRFEPSVMRATVMAGLALGGRLAGIALEAWQLLSLAVTVLLVVDPGLTASVGFQLSVAATAGVLVGARWPVRGRMARALSVTIGAQVAVAPLILAHFGEVPLMSPVANLVAAPLVAVSTVLGAVGVALAPPLIDLAAWMAGLVLVLARGAAHWPQLGPAQMAVAGVVALVLIRRPGSRRVAVIVGSAALTVTLVVPHGRPAGPGAVVLDVGQGDAILLDGGDGHYALVDGGPDHTLIIAKLREMGVRSLDLVVATHVHADHLTGLIGVLGRLPVGRVWQRFEPHETPSSRELMSVAGSLGVDVRAPPTGTRQRLGSLELTVEGPARQYASPNDQSIVLLVRGPDRTLLLSGDIETHAQAELGHLRADVLKVPHQGGATSEPGWLEGVGARLAVISVGPNGFGHPADWVIDTLQASGARVLRTDESGDVVIPLG